MIFETLIIMVLFAIYGAAIWGLAALLSKLGVPPKSRIVISFLIFAAGMGLWAALAWPLDSIMLINFPGATLGEILYEKSILYMGDPSSPQAHYTIPWLLRVPQVHFVGSIIFWGLAGLIIQMIRNLGRRSTIPVSLLPLW